MSGVGITVQHGMQEREAKLELRAGVTNMYAGGSRQRAETRNTSLV